MRLWAPSWCGVSTLPENLFHILRWRRVVRAAKIFPTSLGSDLYLAIEREPGADAHVDAEVDLVTTQMTTPSSTAPSA